MRMTLMIVEQAYRGAVESQYSHSIWYAQAHGTMGDIADVLLLGDAYRYALRNQQEITLQFGEKNLRVVYDFERTINALISSGAQVYVSARDHERYGNGQEKLIVGVTVLDNEAIVDAIEAHEYVAYC